MPQEYEYATSQRSSSTHLCVASVASLVACCISPVACSALMSAYCASCLHIANEALLHRRRQVARWCWQGGKQWQITEKSMQQQQLLPSPSLPLLSPRSQNFKPTQNVDPFFQRGKLRQAHRAEAASRSWELEKHLSCTFPVLPTPCSPLPLLGHKRLNEFPEFQSFSDFVFNESCGTVSGSNSNNSSVIHKYLIITCNPVATLPLSRPRHSSGHAPSPRDAL